MAAISSRRAAATPAPTFDVRVVAGLVAAGVLAFAAFLVLAAYAGDFGGGRDGRPHALSVAATGFRGITRLVEATGGEARLLRHAPETETEDLLVVTIEESFDTEELAQIAAARSVQPTLLILPKWTTVPDPTRPAWVARVGTVDTDFLAEVTAEVAELEVEQVQPAAGAVAGGTGILAGVRFPAPALSQSVSGPGVTPLLTLPDRRVLLGRIGEGPLYLLSDPDVMSNHGLRDPRTARAALAILAGLNSTGAEGVAFDLTLNGLGQRRSALRLLFDPPFLALTLALAAAALLAGLHGAFRFGPERSEERAIAFGKAALVENSAGLIRMARREHRAGGAYAELIRDAAARASGAAGALKRAELDTYLDRLSRPGEPTFSDLARRADAAGDRHDLVAAARALFLWKKDIRQ